MKRTLLVVAVAMAAIFAFAMPANAAITRSSGDIAVPIPDCCNNPASHSFTVAGPTTGVTDVDAFVRLNHTWDSDLVISLISPMGTTVTLSNRRGGSGDNFGTGANNCTGTPTRFDDEGPTPIGSGTAPFGAGPYRPDSPLSALDTQNANGNWTLRVQDFAGADIGVIGCWGVVLSYADSDGDGLDDGEEFDLGTDASDPDTDGDLFGDGTEVAGGSDPLNWLSIPTPAGPVTVTDGGTGPLDDLDPLF